MKFSLLSVLILALVHLSLFTSTSFAEQCSGTGLQCADISQPCDQTDPLNPYSGRSCKYGSYCGTNTNTCQTFKKVGETCDVVGVDSQCLYPLACNNGTCQEVGYAVLGDACSGNSQCVSPLVCTNNVCSSDKANCTSNYECGYDQFCFTHPVSKATWCLPRIEDGQLCSQNFTKITNATTGASTNVTGYFTCSEYSSCTVLNRSNKTIMTCAPRYSAGSLGVCAADKFGVDYNCNTEAGLLCYKSTCVNSTGELTSPTLMCNSTYTRVCGDNYEVCSCGQKGVGQCLQSELRSTEAFSLCGQAKKKLTACASAHRCTYSANPSKSSCMITNCSTQFCDKYSLCDVKGPGTINPCSGLYPQQNALCLDLGYTGYNSSNYNHPSDNSNSHSSATITLPSSFIKMMTTTILFTVSLTTLVLF
ncbi:hypothetical protein DFA_02799 [Cavenderia fasciculata]|uniref:Paramecium surface antigen repeat-containing protein n=1 Tax=Cavenderia fasciculata TaxID=261658 RepID=F4PIC2_CACFS|nr:uncharacterized protein DFA_02799 [Cavenderia fasciculata]EGG24556.1 hypothetical protein DFA_02799 [Cavenderia fasciculata]|eukprot:XP_004362407.1 hypothetical protein DFA_02799 [Cavenderia fasciculata]